jgi:superfamily II RNA helicase
VEGSLISTSDTAAVKHIWNFHLSHHKKALEDIPQYHTLYELVQRGVAFHHSGIVPMLKEIIEILFGKGLIKVLFATETFAVGINMPTKTAVFIGLKKYDEERGGMRILNTAEYIQMAGRAGRRGLDTMGTVIYLPDRDPVEPLEMKAMMCGGKAPVTSRMEFGYDFILKTIQSGNSNWLDLLSKSYWRRQREQSINYIKVDQYKALSKLKQIIITEDEAAAINEKEAIELQIRENNNAKRKKAELALRVWKDNHLGPRWQIAEQKAAEFREINNTLRLINRDLEIALDVSSTVEARIRVLESLGFLKPIEDPTKHTRETLTTLGILATELNEMDALLMSQFYMMEGSTSLEPVEVLTILAACITEAKKDGEQPTIDQLNTSEKVKSALHTLNGMWHKLCDREAACGARQSEWSLSTFWIDPMLRWIEGNSVASICSEFGVYEGNLIRSVLKLQNMLEEWRSMAQYCNDVEVLDRFRDANSLLIRETVIQDSLYLHI